MTVQLQAAASTALLLGLVKAQVGLVQQAAEVFLALIHPGAERQRWRVVGVVHAGALLAQLVELGAQLFGWQWAAQGELFTAQAADQGLAEGRLQQTGKAN